MGQNSETKTDWTMESSAASFSVQSIVYESVAGTLETSLVLRFLLGSSTLEFCCFWLVGTLERCELN